MAGSHEETNDEGLFQLQIAVAIDQAGYPLEEIIHGYVIALQQIEPRGDLTEAVLQVKFRLRELIHAEESSSRPEYSIQESPPTDILPTSAQILFALNEPALHLFHVQSNEKVNKHGPIRGIYIYKFLDTFNPEDSPVFLQVSSWIYPLVRGKTSVIKSPNGNYMFPSLEITSSDAIGLLFPSSVSSQTKYELDKLLNELISPLSHIEECKKFSSQMSSSLVEGAETVGVGMVKGAIKASGALHRASESLKDRIAPQEEPLSVDPAVKTAIEVTHWFSVKGVKVTGFLLSKVGSGTLALGRYLAPHIKRQSVRALSSLAEQPEERSQEQLSIASDVVGGTVTAVSTLYTALENSTKVIAQNAANSTVKVVTHKYGLDAGDATNKSLSALGNTYLTMYNAGALTVKGVAKRTVKDTSKLSMNVPEDVIAGRRDPLKVMDEAVELQEEEHGEEETPKRNVNSL
eukprot:TRINITY_DN15063_c0_g1_i1.p1 TRINITY_DN15063_c0_g1~~TRINITY_DN15063_c0_g1_i1.p1  ORF type:complete len:461 (-),score=99.67 TRINITY_DN15063_c0_g1_i1:389-1771(-)